MNPWFCTCQPRLYFILKRNLVTQLKYFLVFIRIIVTVCASGKRQKNATKSFSRPPKKYFKVFSNCFTAQTAGSNTAKLLLTAKLILAKFWFIIWAHFVPWFSGYGNRLMINSSWVLILSHKQDSRWIGFHICCWNCTVVGDGPNF